ncbi:MAG: TldD/PmbA family protein [Clostridia bacterium]|nr:TldD/PmbA family protein [Clostridia bacterium]
MYTFQPGFYIDVRTEEVYETNISYTLGNLDESKVRKYKAAFIRVFDGTLWYYSATSDLDHIQEEIDKLCQAGKPNADILNHPIVKAFEVNRDECLQFSSQSVSDVNKEKKENLLKSFFPVLSEYPAIKMWKSVYIDAKKIINIVTSKGADVTFDMQRAGFSIQMSFSEGEKRLAERYSKVMNTFEALPDDTDALKAFIAKCQDFMNHAKPVSPGKFTVILSPEAAGVFAHESFGHKSESDFMVGDETMKREWALGKKVGSDILSIVDSGLESGSGYTPYDDEGTKAKKTYLIKDGILTGRLHSASTAALLEEGVTGNARAMNFEYEPIVRMTTTYILPGEKTLEQLISEVEDGFLVETIKHGSGLSTFTIAPSLSYRIQNGKVTEPVNISVISGTVFDTLSEIDGVSDKLELLSFVTGGCGKMEQYPLPVGFGGPYVRVKNMTVQ